MKKAIQPAIFKWRQMEPELILCAVRWYLRDSLSLRDAEELLSERGRHPLAIVLVGPIQATSGDGLGRASTWTVAFPLRTGADDFVF